jgi:DNA-binding GntR family transcriptional regulator
MSFLPLIRVQSLKEQVYDHLRGEMQKGRLSPGATLNQEEICRRLGVSRTPLREALLQLEMEDFITIRPRRAVMVKSLTRQEIKDIYGVIGALEAQALAASFAALQGPRIRTMAKLIGQMSRAIEANDFDSYYEKNLSFHNIYLESCGNEKLIRIVNTLKKRLYDFPRPSRFIKEWEVASIAEHRKLLGLIRQGKKQEAARFVRNVHWSFAVQEKFIRLYYPRAGWTDQDKLSRRNQGCRP